MRIVSVWFSNETLQYSVSKDFDLNGNLFLHDAWHGTGQYVYQPYARTTHSKSEVGSQRDRPHKTARHCRYR
ncbi:hypothetical protein NPIL_165261 [Nephila pilipes]|uniref:Uncharacterized protein n=1 Tax=Nephila pilipes TaxID=299642 RepID=A0A8X6PZD1_NEPPI|nr:hypothetical protein NPIL_165261 [Nephila pilipes]